MASPLTTWSTSADGRISSNGGATYSTARSGGGTLTAINTDASNKYAIGQFYSGGVYRCLESFIDFGTSSIGAGSTVTVATLSLYGFTSDARSDEFNVLAFSDDWNGTLEGSDWVAGASFGTTLASKDTTGWSVSGYNDLTSSADFLTALAQAGTTYLAIGSSRTSGNNEPTANEYIGIYYAEDNTGGGGTDRDPKLYVEYTAGGGGPSMPGIRIERHIG